MADEAWYGGGCDLTPSYLVEGDTHDFHCYWKNLCDNYKPGLYSELKEWCDRYKSRTNRVQVVGVISKVIAYFKMGTAYCHGLAHTRTNGRSTLYIL